MDPAAYNRRAWDCQVEMGNRWTVPVSPEAIARARAGDWSIVITAERPVPRDWFPPLRDLATLCLAGSGGQQAPLLAAAGARVTVLDNSPLQLAQDRLVAEREGLAIETVLGDMRDLSPFADRSFDLIVHPCSSCFVPDVRPVFREAFRVLRPGGALLSGATNPFIYVFDEPALDAGRLVVRHRIPYSDLHSLTDEERRPFIDSDEPLVFGHTLEDLIGGQLDCGFAITGFYEDQWPDKAFGAYMPGFIATRAVRPA